MATDAALMVLEQLDAAAVLRSVRYLLVLASSVNVALVFTTDISAA
jgi:hypothetical protein